LKLFHNRIDVRSHGGVELPALPNEFHKPGLSVLWEFWTEASVQLTFDFPSVVDREGHSGGHHRVSDHPKAKTSALKPSYWSTLSNNSGAE
jgi:hypothetical protein